jgi:hypothetical protein
VQNRTATSHFRRSWRSVRPCGGSTRTEIVRHDLGPFVWVLFGEMFPNWIRAFALVLKAVNETKGGELEDMTG